jgi:hypothetical protein
VNPWALISVLAAPFLLIGAAVAYLVITIGNDPRRGGR